MNSNFPLLEKFSGNVAISKLQTQRELTIEIQTLLKDAGFLKTKVDGIFGLSTTAAFRNFKKDAFLQFPDILGEATAKALLEIAGKGQHPTPVEAINAAKFEVGSQGKTIYLPSGATVGLAQPISGSLYFTWGEATHNGTRIPSDTLIVQRISQTAKYLDLVRELFDHPIKITSWYRPPLINSQVGGVSNSRHLIGDAVDFVVDGIAPYKVYSRLDNWHGGRGGLGNSAYFTHLDLRGYAARWLYGNA